MKQLSKRAIAWTVGLATGLAGIFCFALWSIVPTLNPSPTFVPTRVLAGDGSLLYEVSAADREATTPVKLADMPESLVQAVVSAEDKRFYEHHGIDWLAFARAMRDNIAARSVVSGGSTIEQQLMKNLSFPGESRGPMQKLREMIAAGWWAATHTKDETLERYLNTVYLGNNLFGVQTGSQEYFRKSVTDLSVPEAALLAGIIGAPSRYEPVSHWDAAVNRQAYVLAHMVENGYLDASEQEAAADTPLTIFRPRHEMKAPHFVFRVLELLELAYPDIATGGYTITTTLDRELQTITEESVSRQLLKLVEEHVTNAAVVAADPRTGDVLAYVGSVGYWDDAHQGAVNMAAALRQPGSALKPFAYQLALMNGFVTPGTVISDMPVEYEVDSPFADETDTYIPRNYNYRYNGPVTVRDALGSSLNIPAVKIVEELGLNAFFHQLARFGLTFPNPPEHYGLGIVLGGGEVTLEDATHAFGVLAAENESVPLRFVTTIRDLHGFEVFRAPETAPTNVFDPEDRIRASQATALVTDILSDKTARSLSFGEASQLEIGPVTRGSKPVAAKTGTTKDFRDNWAFGYTPDFVLGIWAGNADNSHMYGVSGISGAVPIWHDVLAFRYRYADPPPVAAPEGIVARDICLPSGMLATPICPKTRTERFIEGSEPTQPDIWYQSVCLSRAVSQTYLIPPPEYLPWVRDSGFAPPPSKDCVGQSVVFME